MRNRDSPPTYAPSLEREPIHRMRIDRGNDRINDRSFHGAIAISRRRSFLSPPAKRHTDFLISAGAESTTGFVADGVGFSVFGVCPARRISRTRAKILACADSNSLDRVRMTIRGVSETYEIRRSSDSWATGS